MPQEHIPVMYWVKQACSEPGGRGNLVLSDSPRPFILTSAPFVSLLTSKIGLGPLLTWLPWQSWKSRLEDRELPVLPRGCVLWQQPDSGADSPFMHLLPDGKTGQSQVSHEGPPHRSPASQAGPSTTPPCDFEPVTAPSWPQLPHKT